VTGRTNWFESRWGPSLRRAPFVWCALTVVVLWTFAPAMVTAAKRHTSAWADVVAASLMAWGVVAWFAMNRRWSRSTASEEQRNSAAVSRWGIATSPFLYGVVSPLFGASRWFGAIGLLVSMVLLVLAARQIHAQERPSTDPDAS
jgi:hypothetical protein